MHPQTKMVEFVITEGGWEEAFSQSWTECKTATLNGPNQPAVTAPVTQPAITVPEPKAAAAAAKGRPAAAAAKGKPDAAAAKAEAGKRKRGQNKADDDNEGNGEENNPDTPEAKKAAKAAAKAKAKLAKDKVVEAEVWYLRCCIDERRNTLSSDRCLSQLIG